MPKTDTKPYPDPIVLCGNCHATGVVFLSNGNADTCGYCRGRAKLPLSKVPPRHRAKAVRVEVTL